MARFSVGYHYIFHRRRAQNKIDISGDKFHVGDDDACLWSGVY
jgi:hypothetical protein